MAEDQESESLFSRELASYPPDPLNSRTIELPIALSVSALYRVCNVRHATAPTPTRGLSIYLCIPWRSY